MNKNNSLAQVRCFLLDMDGTIYLGEKLLDGAQRFLDVLGQQGCEYIFLTNNSSKNSQQYAEKFARLGLTIPREKIMTSGEATAMHVRRQQPGARVYVVGTEALEDEFRSRGFVLTEEAPDIAVLGFDTTLSHNFHSLSYVSVVSNPDIAVLGFDTTLTYDKLWKLCDLVRAGVRYIATHPDFNCPTETGFMPDIGAMIAFVKASTGREPDLIVGKPNSLFAEQAAERTGIPVSEMCMVGDRLYTDIALGGTAGIPTILVLSGETQAHEVADSPFQPTYIFQDIQAVADHLTQKNSET